MPINSRDVSKRLLKFSYKFLKILKKKSKIRDSMQFVKNWFGSAPSVKKHSFGPVRLSLASLGLARLSLQCVKPLRGLQFH